MDPVKGPETPAVAGVRSAGEPTDCVACHGDGWYVGHEDACYEDGDCNCPGVQIGCDRCDGTGVEPAECPTCHGLGEWMHWVAGDFVRCGSCDGTGWLPSATGSGVQAAATEPEAF